MSAIRSSLSSGKGLREMAARRPSAFPLAEAGSMAVVAALGTGHLVAQLRASQIHLSVTSSETVTTVTPALNRNLVMPDPHNRGRPRPRPA
jgi:hypothetical protein